MMIELTTEAGAAPGVKFAVNAEYVMSVRPRTYAGETMVEVQMSSGLTYEVQGTYGDILAQVTQAQADQWFEVTGADEVAPVVTR